MQPKTKDFTKVAQKSTSTSGFNYDAAVTEIFDMYPQAREKVHFYDLTRSRFVDPDPWAIQEACVELAEHEPTRTRFMEYAQKYKAEGNSAVIYALPRGRCVMLSTGSNRITMLGKNTPAHQDIYFVLDHELGHVLAQHGGRGRDSQTMHECVADSFAALRHMQRFGTESPAVEQLLLSRARRLVSLTGYRHSEHFTSFTLEKLLDIKNHVDVERLTPQQTLDLATRIALTHTPNDVTVIQTAKAFKPFQEALEIGDRNALHRLAHIVIGTKDNAVFKWGAPVLRGYMDGTLGDTTNGKKKIIIPKTDFSSEYWQRVNRILTRKEFSFAKNEMLYGMNLPKPLVNSSNDNRKRLNPAQLN